MHFTSEEMHVLRALAPGFRVAKTKIKREDYLARAYILFFSNFPIVGGIDMDKDEKLWLMTIKKKVCMVCFIHCSSIEKFLAHSYRTHVAYLELCLNIGRTCTYHLYKFI